MNRYINSFLITLVLYLSAFGVIVYESATDNYCDKKSLNEKSSRICFSMVTLPSPVKKDEPKKEKKVEKKIVKKVEKKVVKKEIVQAKKELLPKEIEKETPKEEEPQEVAKKQEEQTNTPSETKPNVQKVVNTNVQKTVDEDMVKAKQDRFIAHLVERINSNKSYPMAARRRGIEGDVEVKFHVFSDGTVRYIKMVSGKKIFRHSTLEAISKSFPIDIDKTLFNFPKEFRITIAYVLK